MAQTISVKPETINTILSLLRKLQQDMAEVKEKLASAPPYGSDEWWEWSLREGLKDVEAGRFKSFKADEYLKELDKRA